MKDPAATGDFNARYGFSSSGLRWRYDSEDYRANTLFGYLYQWQRFAIFGGDYFTQKSHTGTLYHLSSWRRSAHDLSAGFEVQRQFLPIDALLPVPPDKDQVDFDLTSAPTYQVHQVLQPTVYSVFFQDLWQFAERWRTRVGVRGEDSDLGDRAVRIMPRGALIHDLGARDTLSVSAGLYSSRPEEYKRFSLLAVGVSRAAGRHHSWQNTPADSPTRQLLAPTCTPTPTATRACARSMASRTASASPIISPSIIAWRGRPAWTAASRSRSAWRSSLNLTNHRNVIGVEYNDQYQKERDVTGLGLLPSLDVTVRF